MAAAKSGDTIRLHYTGKLDDGTVFDSSVGRDPLEFTIGGGMLIPTLEEACVGMNPGDDATVAIAAEDAYGPVVPEAVQEVDRAMMPDDMELEIGVQLQASGPDGQTHVLTVVEFDDEQVKLDGNHPLAGQSLIFEVEIQAIRDATEEEIRQQKVLG